MVSFLNETPVDRSDTAHHIHGNAHHDYRSARFIVLENGRAEVPVNLSRYRIVSRTTGSMRSCKTDRYRRCRHFAAGRLISYTATASDPIRKLANLPARQLLLIYIGPQGTFQLTGFASFMLLSFLASHNSSRTCTDRRTTGVVRHRYPSVSVLSTILWLWKCKQ
jgi:hypothetical protein